MRRCIMPDVVAARTVVTVTPSTTAREAARMMKEQRISSVLVAEENRLLGIFTVQDVARRIVGAGLDPDQTTLDTVMTKDPQTVVADEIPVRALRCMCDGGFRHLPIIRDGEVVGIVSRGDFFREEEKLLEQEIHLWEEMR